MLLALAHLNCSPSAAWMAAYLARSQQQLRHYTPQGLANTAWALAHLGYRPPQPWARAFLRRCKAQLPHFQSEDFSTIIWALATLDIKPAKPWLHAYLQAMDGKFEGLTPQALTGTIWALAKLEHQPPASWAQAFMAQVDVKSGGHTMDYSGVILHGFTTWAAGRLNLEMGRAAPRAALQPHELLAQAHGPGVAMGGAEEEAPALTLIAAA